MKTSRIAGIVGFLGVALGAFGAHGFKSILEQNGTVPIWQTSTLYHLVHAVVLLVLAARSSSDRAVPGSFWFFLVGVAIFSGSLYTLALTNIRWLGAITPLGGVSLLIGWALVTLNGFGKQPDDGKK